MGTRVCLLLVAVGSLGVCVGCEGKKEVTHALKKVSCRCCDGTGKIDVMKVEPEGAIVKLEPDASGRLVYKGPGRAVPTGRKRSCTWCNGHGWVLEDVPDDGSLVKYYKSVNGDPVLSYRSRR